MDAKELRLGNYIHPLLDKNEVAEICYIGENDFGYERLSDKEYFQGNSIKPIPLTEEWLLKFGFVYCKNYDEYRYKEKTNWFGIFKSEDDDWLFEKPNMSSVVLPSVHQLQNLYFFLTNEELIIVI